MQITPTEQTLGARVTGLDLSQPLTDSQLAELMQALGRHGVLEFPAQQLDSSQLRQFSGRFGELFVSPGGRAQDPQFADVMILSNMVENGVALGLPDAGQSWHTDMSYMPMIALSNVLYGLRIPERDGRALGATQFRNMHAAAETLPQALRDSLRGRHGIHDFNKFWDLMRARPGNTRPPLSAAERAKRPPARHPLLLRHPITGREVLYANPGYLVAIEGLPPNESDALLDALFEHQMRAELLYEFSWTPLSVLMWDNIGTNHNAVADYGPDEHRYIKRCQVMATRFFGPSGTSDPLYP
jgi:taurine dioxygenase